MKFVVVRWGFGTRKVKMFLRRRSFLCTLFFFFVCKACPICMLCQGLGSGLGNSAGIGRNGSLRESWLRVCICACDIIFIFFFVIYYSFIIIIICRLVSLLRWLWIVIKLHGGTTPMKRTLRVVWARLMFFFCTKFRTCHVHFPPPLSSDTSQVACSAHRVHNAEWCGGMDIRK